MDNIVLVQVVHCAQNLLDGLRGVLLGELPLLTDSVEQLPSRSKLGDDVVLVLEGGGAISASVAWGRTAKNTHPRLEPIGELDDMRVLQTLEQIQLV